MTMPDDTQGTSAPPEDSPDALPLAAGASWGRPQAPVTTPRPQAGAQVQPTKAPEPTQPDATTLNMAYPLLKEQGGDFARIQGGFKTTADDVDAQALAKLAPMFRQKILTDAGHDPDEARMLSDKIDGAFGITRDQPPGGSRVLSLLDLLGNTDVLKSFGQTVAGAFQTATEGTWANPSLAPTVRNTTSGLSRAVGSLGAGFVSPPPPPNSTGEAAASLGMLAAGGIDFQGAAQMVIPRARVSLAQFGEALAKSDFSPSGGETLRGAYMPPPRPVAGAAPDIFDAASRAPDLRVPTTPESAITDMRGRHPDLGSPEAIASDVSKKPWYHGTGANLTAESLDPLVGKSDSLFGSGVYLTDNPSVAEGYAKTRGARTGTPNVYQVGVTPGRVLNLESGVTPEFMGALRKAVYPDILPEVERAAAAPGATGESVIKSLMSATGDYSHAEGLPASEFDEQFGNVAIELRNAGYDGLTHTGGLRAKAGQPEHRVLIMLDPNNYHSNLGQPSQISSFAKAAAAENTPTSIHALADAKGIAWDNDPAFLKLSKDVTGKEHLDDMTPAELGQIKIALDNRMTPDELQRIVSDPKDIYDGAKAEVTGRLQSLREDAATRIADAKAVPSESRRLLKEAAEVTKEADRIEADFAGEVRRAVQKFTEANPRPVEPKSGPLSGDYIPPKGPPGGIVKAEPPVLEPVPRFTPLTERLIDNAHNVTGVDRSMWENAASAASAPAEEISQLRSFFNHARAFSDPALVRNPDMQTSYLAATRYSSAEGVRVAENMATIQRMLTEAFGADAVKGFQVNVEGAMTDLPALTKKADYVGTIGNKIGTATENYVGSLFHVLDNPKDYRLTPLQQRAVAETDQILRDELKFSQDVGLKVGEFQDNWIGHIFKDADKQTIKERIAAAVNAPGRAGGGPRFAERTHTTDEWLKIGQDAGLQPETNVLKIYENRLNATAKARSDQVFIDNLVPKVGGRELAPAEKTRIGERAVTVNGTRYALPEKVADDVESVLAKAKNPSVTDKIIGGVVDGARNMLLNLDASVGFGRHAWLAFSFDPAGTIKDWGTAAAMLTTPDGKAHWLLNNTARLQEASEAGLNLHMSASSFMSGGASSANKNVVARLPLFKQFNEAQFNTVLPVLKLGRYDTARNILMTLRDQPATEDMVRGLPFFDKILGKAGAKASLQGMSDAQINKTAADAVNNLMGGVEWAKIGNDPGIARKTLLLTEGWTRAHIGEMTNVPKMGPKGVLARRMLMGELAMAATLATAISLKLSNKLPSYNPRDGTKFLAPVLPNGDTVSLLPHEAIIKAIAGITAGAEPGTRAANDKNAIVQRLDAASQYAGGRMGQLPRVGIDLVRGTDYYGQPIDNKALYVAKQGAPIVVQQVADDLGQSAGASQAATAGAAQLLGFTGRAPTRTDELDAYVQNAGLGESWAKLTIAQQDQLEQTDTVKGIFDRHSRDTAYDLMRQQKFNEVQMEQERDKDLLAGTVGVNGGTYTGAAWRADHASMEQRIGTRAETANLLLRQQQGKVTDPNEQALAGLYALQQKFNDPRTGKFDNVGYADAKDAYLQGLPPTQIAYIGQNIHPNATVTEKDYYKLQGMLSTAGWSDMSKSYDLFAGLHTAAATYWQQYQQAKQSGPGGVATWEGTTPNPEGTRLLIAAIQKREAAAQLQYRQSATPEFDRLYSLFNNAALWQTPNQAVYFAAHPGSDLQVLHTNSGAHLGPAETTKLQTARLTSLDAISKAGPRADDIVLGLSAQAAAILTAGKQPAKKAA